MSDSEPSIGSTVSRAATLSRWDDEGGAGPCVKRSAVAGTPGRWDSPDLSNADLIQPRIRVIALENGIIAFLAHAPEAQLQTA